MKICLSGRIVENFKPTLEEFIKFAAECGYDGVSLRPWQLPKTEDTDSINRLFELLSSKNMIISSCNISGPKDIDSAAKIGCKVMQTSITDEICALLPPGTRLGPQMHTGGPYETISSAAQALRETPDCAGVFVEPGNFILAGEPFSPEMFEPLHGRIIGCNFQSIETGSGTGKLKLADGSEVIFDRVPLAENKQMPFKCFLEALHNVGYNGFINVIEPANDPISAREIAMATLSTIKSFTQKP